MDCQLIFVVETNKKCKSDWIYIKSTIDYFFTYDNAQVKLNVVYMDGKGKYKNKTKEINSLISQFSSRTKQNQSNVIFCFDLDDYDIKQEDRIFLQNAEQYCKEKGFDFAWFCKDIERVYLGEKIDDKQKKNAAAEFKRKNSIINIDENKLIVDSYKNNSSNILKIIDKYLKRK